MSLGVDVEYFVAQEGKTTIVPALLAFSNAMKRGVATFQPVFKDIIGPDFKGYNSMYIEMGTTQVTEDGAAVETPCNPGSSARKVLDNIAPGVLMSIRIAKANDGYLSVQPLVWLDQEHVQLRDELRVLGCDPDIGFWDGVATPKCPPQDPERTMWRTGGGHIHLSPTNIFEVTAQESTIVFGDLLLGTLDVLLEHTADAVTRRTMYGQAGRHRLQPWGIEYRTMSNTWFAHPEIALAVLQVAELIHQAVEAGVEPWDIVERIGFQEIITAINTCNTANCFDVFNHTLEELVNQGLKVNPKAIILLQDIFKRGGVVHTYGYDMLGWEVDYVTS
jgi:hypothetical protein